MPFGQAIINGFYRRRYHICGHREISLPKIKLSKTRFIFLFSFIAVIEIAIGEYDVDMGKLMAAAVKKFHEERDTYYLGTYKRDNFIRADSGTC